MWHLVIGESMKFADSVLTNGFSAGLDLNSRLWGMVVGPNKIEWTDLISKGWK